MSAGPQAGGLPGWRRHQPLGLWWVLPPGLAAALWLLVDGQIRVGGYVIAGTLAVAAVLRMLLPRDLVGGLLVRSRTVDVLILAALSLAMVVLSATLVIR